MTPTRCGTLPQRALIDLCFSGQAKDSVIRSLFQQGGLASLLGTTDLEEVERRIEAGDSRAALVFEAMAHSGLLNTGLANHPPSF